MFKDRTDAGLLLVKKLSNYHNNKDAVVVTIPRGGIPLGYVISKGLHLPLELVLSKKIGHPLHKEFAIGAVTLTDRILSDAANDVSRMYIEAETSRIRTLLKERQDGYYDTRKPISFKNKIVIVVDDGVATGNTLMSSIKLIEKQKPSQIIVALPVGPPSVIEKIKKLPYVNDTICLLVPENFRAVGQFYKNFDPIKDNEVVTLLEKANTTFQLNT
ncbi:phosphoribosyltransferase family protein [Algibacter sp.]|nr:phosphoribosyltransferase family protein [Algibacter sp.]MDA9070151.1 phosphoribosyltransferase family protein [Algibacter sp.]MDA9775512.1 phosphoribosyltransferase family protein [Algibacter sp.]MDB9859185.1 phosphoribosyltransferase family protein [Flavobacteriaceae bacterium]